MNSRYESSNSTYTARRRETETSTEKTSRVRKFAVAGIISVALLAAGAVNYNMSRDAKAGPAQPAGEITKSITEMKLASGAIIRSSPRVTDPDVDLSNRLGSLDFGDANQASIDTPEGVYTFSDQNGTWYGIDRDDIKSSIGQTSANLDIDRDGIVWINEQKANPDESK